MSQCICGLAIRKASTLSLAGAVLSGISCRGDDIASPTQPAAPAEVGPALSTGVAEVVSFRQVSPSSDGNHTCAVSMDSRAFCWGIGYLGDGPASQRLMPLAVASGFQFRQVSTGHNYTCGVTTGNRAYCWGKPQSPLLGQQRIRAAW
jgi:Regulator of Chromosome Condensation (RCC1) repeat protein